MDRTSIRSTVPEMAPSFPLRPLRTHRLGDAADALMLDSEGRILVLVPAFALEAIGACCGMLLVAVLPLAALAVPRDKVGGLDHVSPIHMRLGRVDGHVERPGRADEGVARVRGAAPARVRRKLVLFVGALVKRAAHVEMWM